MRRGSQTSPLSVLRVFQIFSSFFCKSCCGKIQRHPTLNLEFGKEIWAWVIIRLSEGSGLMCRDIETKSSIFFSLNHWFCVLILNSTVKAIPKSENAWRTPEYLLLVFIFSIRIVSWFANVYENDAVWTLILFRSILKVHLCKNIKSLYASERKTQFSSRFSLLRAPTARENAYIVDS